jgi:hypothetical protein
MDISSLNPDAIEALALAVAGLIQIIGALSQ